MQKDFVCALWRWLHLTLDQWASEPNMLKSFYSNIFRPIPLKASVFKPNGRNDCRHVVYALHYFGQMQQQTLSPASIARIDEKNNMFGSINLPSAI